MKLHVFHVNLAGELFCQLQVLGTRCDGGDDNGRWCWLLPTCPPPFSLCCIEQGSFVGHDTL